MAPANSAHSSNGDAPLSHAPPQPPNTNANANTNTNTTASAATAAPQPQPQPQPQIALQQPTPQPPARLQRSHSSHSSHSQRGAGSMTGVHPPSFTFATSAAAAATSAKSRPKLNLSTSYASQASQGSLPSPPSATAGQTAPPNTAASSSSSASAVPGRRRLWFRKKAGGPATSLLVDSTELVDDVKSRVLMKYPTSLLQNCDPADLVLTAAPNGSSRIELQPDENIWAVLDRHYATGMTIHDALELSLPNASASATSSSLQASLPTRTALQRARSYSNNSSHYQGYSSLSPSAGPPPMPQNHPGASEPNTPLSISPHNASPGAHPSSTGPHSPIESRQDSRQNTSVLLMPRQLGGPSGPLSVNAERELDGHATTLVPLTGEPSPSNSHGPSSWNDAGGFGAGNGNGSGGGNGGNGQSSHGANHAGASAGPLSSLPSSGMPTPSLATGGLASLQVGKSSIVPQINVLIVEDNKINQLILERFLQRKNVRCAVATNGREALEKWRAGGFHLILMDIQLPEMSGLEVTKEIRRLEIVNGIGAFPQAFRGQELPTTPASEDVLPKSEGGFRSPVIIVALTASSEMLDKSEALAAGCNDFLTKPVNLTWLEQKITEWGCMQALIDYAGWKQWSADSPYRSLSRAELHAKHPEQKQIDNQEAQRQEPLHREQHSQGPIAMNT